MQTVWVFGDQLNRNIGAMANAEPANSRVLMIESAATNGRAFHRQRLHLVLTAMRRFATELRVEGFDVDYRRAPSFRRGFEEHHREYEPDAVTSTEPNSRKHRALAAALGVHTTKSNQFLTHPEVFAEWAGTRQRLRLEDFYRWQRKRLGYLLDTDGEPAGGRWNYDHDNREPPPSDGEWQTPLSSPMDAVDREVFDSVSGVGRDPVGWWPTSRAAALARLEHFVDSGLSGFGRHEDAMTTQSWHLAHSLLSPALNLGLLLPDEVCDAVETAYRAGDVPISSAEGFIRQVIGWREFVWGIYWLWPDQRDENIFAHHRPLPPSWDGAPTDMLCVAEAIDGLEKRAWIHHIQRLMVLSNFANLYGMEPHLVHDWMRERYIDGADWVMGPNVYGMGLWSDGGRMATKPYVSGGAYINRMSDYCGECRFNPRKRIGHDACPFTTLYWDFLARHEETLRSNHRLARQYAAMKRLEDLPQVRQRAAEVVAGIEEGTL